MLFLSIHGYTFEIKLELLILQIKGPTDCLPNGWNLSGGDAVLPTLG